MTTYIDKWQAVADDVLSVLLVNPGRWEDAINAGVAETDLPPGPWQKVYHTAIELATAPDCGPFLPDTEVAIQAGEGVSVEWVAERIGLHDSSRESIFPTQLNRLTQFGEGHGKLRTLATGQSQIVAALNNGLDVTTPTLVVMRDLQYDHEQSGQSARFGDIAGEAEAQLAAPPPNVLDTGIWLINKWLGGIGEEEFIAFAGPNKQRKTSIEAHALINLARQGKRISVFSFDEHRHALYFRLMAQLMAEYLYNHDAYNLADEETGAPLNIISRKTLARAGTTWTTWAEPLREARTWAKTQLAAFADTLRVYDQSICPNTIEAVIARCGMDARRFGLDGVMLDHTQSLDGYESDYHLMRDVSTKLHMVRGRYKCFMWVLSQQNKAGIAGRDSGEWSSEMAGGPALEQKADTILVSKYKMGTYKDPRVCRIELKQARDEESQLYGYVEMHPASGWITPRTDPLDYYGLKESSEDEEPTQWWQK